MEMSEIGARERFEAIAHSVRDVFWRSAGFIRERRTSVKMRSKFTIPRWNFLIDRSLGNNVTNLLLGYVYYCGDRYQ